MENFNLDFYWTILPFVFIVCVILTIIAIPEIIRIAFEKQLFDVPDYRKVHKGQVPRLGGVTFLPGIMISVLLAYGIMAEYAYPVSAQTEILFGAAGALFLYMTGVADDLVGLSYKVKFPIQIISAFMLCASGLWVDNFHGLLGIHEIPTVVGIPFTVVLVVLIINAINLIDGIDGLASGLCILTVVVYTVMLIKVDLAKYAVITVAALGVLLPFYLYNVYGTSAKRTKIFMGDAGSLTMGYLVAAIAVKASVFSDSMFEEKSQAYYFIYAFSILLVPVLDVMRLFIHRIIHKRSPFYPDRCHIHHKFMAIGMSIGQARHTIIGISLVFFLINIFLVGHININILIAGDIVLWTVMHLAVSHRIRVLKTRHAASASMYQE